MCVHAYGFGVHTASTSAIARRDFWPVYKKWVCQIADVDVGVAQASVRVEELIAKDAWPDRRALCRAEMHSDVQMHLQVAKLGTDESPGLPQSVHRLE
ncbi:hypothetical protein SB3_31715 [Methylobacterium radiotolerans]|nr:hypothetical protein SB3_31715 [Methylobacterium radiotolerans]